MEKTIAKITQGCVELITHEELRKKLASKKPLRIKAGFDPTAPDLHLGHVVLLQKLKAFQDLGHQVILLIGDFTARIGDPSGCRETRPMLSEKAIQENAKTYIAQVEKVLDVNKAEIRYNSEWLGKVDLTKILGLTSRYTVARMLERDDFEKRYQSGEPIGIHEFLYPLLQGYDSVELKADVELGGTDQKFNLLVGRHVQHEFGQETQVIMTLPLLIGTDGVQKMSKSYGNAIGIQEPPQEIFGKLMSISDELMWSYFELLTDRSPEKVATLRSEVASGRHHPKATKQELAFELTARFHGTAAAQKAAAEFERVFAAKKLPSEIETVSLAMREKKISLPQLIVQLGLAESNSEAGRLIAQGGVRLNERKVDDRKLMLAAQGEYLLQVGKRRFKKVLFNG